MTRLEHQLLHEIEREHELLDELAAIESNLFDTFATAIAKAKPTDTPDPRA